MKNPVIESYSLSDIGTIRANNEDVIATLPSHRFFAIADGMGGHKAGEIAAKEATNELIASIMELLSPTPKNVFSQDQIILSLTEAIVKANTKVFALGQENISFKGMGTTLCCLYLHDDKITYAHVGDSRVYLLRENNIEQLTEDHSLISKLRNTGQISSSDDIPQNYKHIITKAIGTHDKVIPSVNYKKCYPKDRFLLCSDGLSDYIANDKISDIINSSASNKLALKKLIEAAKNNGSRDNISGLIVEIKDFK